MRDLVSRFRYWIAAVIGGAAVMGGGAMMLASVNYDVNIGATPTATATATATATPGTFNLGVSAGTCDSTPTRVGTAVASGSLPGTAVACTFDQAYDAANAGDRVFVANGTYTDTEVDTSGTKASDVTFVGESQGGVVAAGEMELAGTHTHLQNMTLNSGTSHGWFVRTEADDVTWTDVILRGEFVGFEVFAGDRFTWDGGSLGVEGDVPGERCGGSPNFDTEPIQVNGGDGHRFSNLVIWPQAGQDPPCQDDGFHEEDIRVQSSNTTIENIDFKDGSAVNRNAGSGKIFLSGSGVQGLVIRNVIFGRGEPDSNNHIDANVSGCSVTIAYVTYTDKGTNLTGCTVTNIQNLGPNAPGVSLSTGRISAGNAAIDAAETGTGSDYCVNQLGGVDFEGDPRPTGSACDKGADEYVGG